MVNEGKCWHTAQCAHASTGTGEARAAQCRLQLKSNEEPRTEAFTMFLMYFDSLFLTAYNLSCEVIFQFTVPNVSSAIFLISESTVLKQQ